MPEKLPSKDMWGNQSGPVEKQAPTEDLVRSITDSVTNSVTGADYVLAEVIRSATNLAIAEAQLNFPANERCYAYRVLQAVFKLTLEQLKGELDEINKA